MEKEQITCPVAEHEEPLLSQVKELDFKKLALIIGAGLTVLATASMLLLVLTSHQELVKTLIDAVMHLSSKGIEKL